MANKARYVDSFPDFFLSRTGRLGRLRVIVDALLAWDLRSNPKSDKFAGLGGQGRVLVQVCFFDQRSTSRYGTLGVSRLSLRAFRSTWRKSSVMRSMMLPKL